MQAHNQKLKKEVFIEIETFTLDTDKKVPRINKCSQYTI